jgi:hypothetical protein
MISNQTQLVLSGTSTGSSRNRKKGAAFNRDQCNLLKVDENTKKENLLKRFNAIVEKRVVHHDQQAQTAAGTLVKTKFSSEKNYLWNKCRYSEETKECFYVQSFLDSGKVSVGERVFIEKIDQVKRARRVNSEV